MHNQYLQRLMAIFPLWDGGKTKPNKAMWNLYAFSEDFPKDIEQQLRLPKLYASQNS
jgi:hypothetical protein